MGSINCKPLTIREINQKIRDEIRESSKEIILKNPDAKHNLAVGLVSPATITIKGSAGYYCAGMIDGPVIEIDGNVGWGVAEDMTGGTVIVHKNAGNSAAASMRGGTVVIHGDAGARAGIAMKGGLLVIQGHVGDFCGFMMQKGIIIICGDVGTAVADSMYEGQIFVGGKIKGLGLDTEVKKPTPSEQKFLHKTLTQYKLKAPRSFQKIISGRKLWNFNTEEMAIWKDAL